MMAYLGLPQRRITFSIKTHENASVGEVGFHRDHCKKFNTPSSDRTINLQFARRVLYRKVTASSPSDFSSALPVPSPIRSFALSFAPRPF
jgi:hypothetical protein